MVLALARHISEHGVEGRFYSQIRKYHHQGGWVYWSMAETPEAATLINRCDEALTYEARLTAGTLPKAYQPDRHQLSIYLILSHREHVPRPRGRYVEVLLRRVLMPLSSLTEDNGICLKSFERL